MVCLMLFWNQIVPQAGDPDQATIVANPEPIADLVREQLPESLVQPAFLLETWQWVGIAALVFLAVVVDRLARLVATWLMRRITKAKKGEDQDEAITRFRRPIGLWLGALAALVAYHVTDAASYRRYITPT